MLYCIVKELKVLVKIIPPSLISLSVKYFSTSDAIAPPKEWPRSIMFSGFTPLSINLLISFIEG